MDTDKLKQANPILKVNLFVLLVIIWAIIVRILPLPGKAYHLVSFLPPIAIYLFINREVSERILKPSLLNLDSLVIIFVIWFASLPIMASFLTIYRNLFGDTYIDLFIGKAQDGFAQAIIFTAVIPALLEEVLLRGIILDGYRGKSKLVAAGVNGFLFGLIRLNYIHFLYNFIIGFTTSYLVFATGSLFAGIISHFFHKGLPLFINYLFPPDPGVCCSPCPGFLDCFVSTTFSVVVVFMLVQYLAKINGVDLIEKPPGANLSSSKIFNYPLIITIILSLTASIFFTV